MARYVNGKALHGLSQAYHWLVSGIFGEENADKFFETVGSFFNKYSGSDLTNSDIQKARLEDEIADENATVAYMRQKEFQEMYLTPEAQLKSQAAGYDALGINRMMLAGSQPGASASTAPASSGGTAGSAAGSGDLLGSLMSAIFKAKDLKLQEELGNKELDIKKELGEKELDLKDKEVSAGVAKSTAETEGINIQNKNLQELLNLQKGELKEKISFLGQQIETEPVKRALLSAEVGVQKARQSLITYQAQFARAQAKYGDAYWSALVHGSELMNEWQATTNEFQRSLIKQQIDINNAQLTGMILDNGMLAKDFGYYESNRKYSRVVGGISAGASALSAIGSVALGAGGMLLGAGKGLLKGNYHQPSYHVRTGQGIYGLDPYGD